MPRRSKFLQCLPHFPVGVLVELRPVLDGCLERLDVPSSFLWILQDVLSQHPRGPVTDGLIFRCKVVSTALEERTNRLWSTVEDLRDPQSGIVWGVRLPLPHAFQ